MTETEKKALALVNEVAKHYRANIGVADFDEVERAFYRAIEQHEAFKREVSDAVEALEGQVTVRVMQDLQRFIIAKPDPLVEAINSAPYLASAKETADHIRAAIEARGGRIVWEGE